MNYKHITLALLVLFATRLEVVGEQARPNVLFIAVDDLNDWVGCMGGHPQSVTPNIDRLAKRGTLFANAHCQAPICNPSRLSLMTGKLPSTTGVYYLAPRLRSYEGTRDLKTIPQHFEQHGYATLAAGKIMHAGGKSEFQEYGGNFGGFGPRPKKPISAGHTHSLWDWGEFPDSDDKMPDHKLANWAKTKLEADYDKPFFLAVGFYRPHVPLFAPPKWFKPFPLDAVQLPSHRTDDLVDIPQYGQDLSWSFVAPRHKWMLENNEWEHAVQCYLGSIHFVDAQIGIVLDALAGSKHAENTIVVLWSDHGFHMGTKERWGKRSLWEDSTKVVLVTSGPGITEGQVCEHPVGLIDLYPTLVEACDLPTADGMEGRSLVPLMQNAKTDWPWPALTTFGQNNHTIRSRDWRYIRYVDGSEELYNHENDPHEYNNLIDDDQYQSIVEEMKQWLPKTNVPMAAGSKACDARPGSPADIDNRKPK